MHHAHFNVFFFTFNFDFTAYFYILVLYSVFRKHKLGSFIIDQIGKTVFTVQFLTVANTMKTYY